MGQDINKKYHITDDGEVFRINDDGSFTSMGNAEKMTSKVVEPSPKPLSPATKKNNRILIILLLFIIFGLGGGIIYFLLRDDKGVPRDDYSGELLTDTSDELLLSSDAPIEVASPVIVEAEPIAQPTKPAAPSLETKEEPTSDQLNYSLPTPEVHSTPATTSSSTIDPNKIYDAVEEQAEFPGGDRARSQWLSDNIQWPCDNEGNQLHGDVELDFVIERDGSISNVQITYSDNAALNSEAIRLIGSMPKWTPAKVRDQPVRSPMGISLFF